MTATTKRYDRDDVLRLMHDLGMTTSTAFSRLITVSDSTVRKWLLGVQKPSPLACRKLEKVEELARSVVAARRANVDRAFDLILIEDYVRSLGWPYIPARDRYITYQEIEKLQRRDGVRRRRSKRKIAEELGVEPSTIYRQIYQPGRRPSPLLRDLILEKLGRKRKPLPNSQ